jgi:two-component system phosphate regulon response regulator PhoB
MSSPSSPRESIEEAGFRLVPERLGVCVGAAEVAVTATQFRLLAILMSDPGRTFSRAELVARAISAPVKERTVDVHIKELRRKLEPHGWRVETVRGGGYRYRTGAKPVPGA